MASSVMDREKHKLYSDHLLRLGWATHMKVMKRVTALNNLLIVSVEIRTVCAYFVQSNNSRFYHLVNDRFEKIKCSQSICVIQGSLSKSHFKDHGRTFLLTVLIPNTTELAQSAHNHPTFNGLRHNFTVSSYNSCTHSFLKAFNCLTLSCYSCHGNCSGPFKKLRQRAWSSKAQRRSGADTLTRTLLRAIAAAHITVCSPVNTETGLFVCH